MTITCVKATVRIDRTENMHILKVESQVFETPKLPLNPYHITLHLFPVEQHIPLIRFPMLLVSTLRLITIILLPGATPFLDKTAMVGRNH